MGIYCGSGAETRGGQSNGLINGQSLDKSKSEITRLENHFFDPLPFALNTSTRLDASGFVLKANTVKALQ